MHQVEEFLDAVLTLVAFTGLHTLGAVLEVMLEVDALL